ncbi:helix-turn-helix transcriptional regulator [Candidatus Roizmanbacteria bacterium]|nr:helix-turn-helix transcriptional regulator [Candidatus Roizmanbacteria bacterium]
MSNYRDLKKRLLKNKGIKKEYDRLKLEYELLDKIISLRLRQKMTQKQLAKRLDTKQSAISRLEKGMINPTVEFLNKLASAFGKKLVVQFK